LPRATVGRDGRYTDANEAAADLFGVERSEIIGQPVGSFTAHEIDDEMGARLLGLASGIRVLTSTAVVTRPNGERWPIEFEVWGADNGHRVTMRRIGPAVLSSAPTAEPAVTT
jgi:PAS domain S-box-containing protein